MAVSAFPLIPARFTAARCSAGSPEVDAAVLGPLGRCWARSGDAIGPRDALGETAGPRVLVGTAGCVTPQESELVRQRWHYYRLSAKTAI